MNSNGTYENKDNIFTRDTATGTAVRAVTTIILIVISLTVGYYVHLLNGRLNVADSADTARSLSELREEVALLRRSYEGLRAQNSSLRAEMATLTQENGVVDQIVAHLRTLQGEQQAILSVLAPLKSIADEPQAAESAPEPIAVTAKADHQIVTPRAAAQQAISSAKPDPVVTAAKTEEPR
jgi:cell division protein FtsB